MIGNLQLPKSIKKEQCEKLLKAVTKLQFKKKYPAYLIHFEVVNFEFLCTIYA